MERTMGKGSSNGWVSQQESRRVQTQIEKDLSTLDSLPRTSQKAIPTASRQRASLPIECDPFLPESQIYELSC